MWFSILFYIFSFPVYFHRIGFIVARFYQRAPLEGKRDKKKNAIGKSQWRSSKHRRPTTRVKFVSIPLLFSRASSFFSVFPHQFPLLSLILSLSTCFSWTRAFCFFFSFFFFFKLRIGLHKPTHAFRIDPRVNRRETYIHTRMYIIYIYRERKRRESEHDKLKSEVLENNRAVVFSRRTRPLHLLEHRAEIFHLYPPPALWSHVLTEQPIEEGCPGWIDPPQKNSLFQSVKIFPFSPFYISISPPPSANRVSLSRLFLIEQSNLLILTKIKRIRNIYKITRF